MEAVAAALEAAGDLLEERRDLVRQRQAVIAANPRLREREVVKFARLAAAMAEVLRQRGVDELAASLTGEAGVAVLKTAFDRWIDEDNRRDFRQLVRESVAELQAVTQPAAR